MEWAQLGRRLMQAVEGDCSQIGLGASVNRLVAGSNPARGATIKTDL
jgi:hypothetical protein